MSGDRHDHAASYFGPLVQKRLLASLIVCVALLTQFGASLWGAAAARDGLPGCHRSIAWSLTADVKPSDSAGPEAPAQLPAAGHDHASCSLCQLSFSFIQSDAPVFDAVVVAHVRVALAEPRAPAPTIVFNRSAPARAPPSQA
jgi:hypothetical protein